MSENEPVYPFRLEITFPNSPKTKKHIKDLLGRISTLLEKEKDSLPFEKTSLEKNILMFSAKDFFSFINFEKPIDITIMLPNIENFEGSNVLGNKLLNYVNTVFGDFAKDAKVSIYESRTPDKGESIVKQYMPEEKILKLNELSEKTLKPVGLNFTHSVENRETRIMIIDFEKQAFIVFNSFKVYEGFLPWNLLTIEHNRILKSLEIVEKLWDV